MPIQGPLRELGIHDVFQLLDLSRKTGVLRVTSELRQNEGTIWFESGAVVAATVRSNPHRIGDVLLRAGKVREEDVLRATEMQRAGDARRLGEILIEIGGVSVRELEQQVRAQVEEVVFTVLGWAEGYFVFEEGQATDIPRDARVRITTEALVMEGARRIDEWERIQTRIAHLGVVPHLVRADGGEPGSLRLTPFEWRVLAACDGTLDVRTIARSVAAPEFEVAKTLFGLAAAGVIVLSDPAVAGATLSPRQDPTSYVRQGEEFLRRGDPAAARTMAEALLAGVPDDARGPLLLGRAFLAERRWTEADQALREAVRLEPELAPALRLLGHARAGGGRFEEAVQAWRTWLDLPSRPPEEDRHLASIVRLSEAARTLADAMRGVV
ncbi:MAG TPA: DUF4388 domain-containing protein [Gemmatimonadales bacterium]